MERKDGLSSDVPLVEFINPNETNITQSIPSQSRSHNSRNISSSISPSITLNDDDDDIFFHDHGDQQANTMPSFLSRRVTTGSDDNVENYVEMTNISKRLSLTSEFAFDNIDDSDTAKLTKNLVDYSSEKKHKQLSFGNEDEDNSHDPNLLNRIPSFNKFRRLSRMVTRASSRVVNLANVPLDQLSKEATETFILFLIVANIILLVIDAWDTVGPDNPRRTTWGSSFVDYGLLAIFILYTLEIIARIVVSGFIINPDNNDESFETTPQAKTKSSSITSTNNQKGQFISGIKRYIFKTAFLRHSFNRIDLVAVICYWIDLVITNFGVSHVYVFKALSTLRSLRLLTVTSGGSTILQSLKISAPLLANVMIFISFFFVIISIVDPSGNSNYTLSQQWCGGYIGQDGNHYPYIPTEVKPLQKPIPKGCLCPVGQVCQETANPYNNMVSYDNIFSAMVLTFVLAA
ncbi:380_t:CDS:2, partial [Dentiscutata erythropus]